MQHTTDTIKHATQYSTQSLTITCHTILIKLHRTFTFYHFQWYITYCQYEQVLPKVIWKEPHCKVPISYNGMPQIYPQNCPFHLMITTPSNTPIPRETTLTIPNGNWIQSAVLPQYTFQTHSQT